MKLLITGCAGQVGYELRRQAIERGHETVALDHRALDITNGSAVEAAAKAVDAIINAAAYTQVDLAETNQKTAFAVNSDGAANLALCDRPMVHLSTDYVFDGNKEGPYTEIDSVAPASVYGRSKLAGEQAVAARNARHLILRTSWVFGLIGTNFVKSMLKIGRKRSELNVVEDQRGGPTPATDVAKAAINMLEHSLGQGNSASWGVYHFSGTPDVSWREFASEIFRQAGIVTTVSGISTEQFGAVAPRPKNSTLNCDKIKEVFGINQPNWKGYLENVIAADKLDGVSA